LLPASIKVNFVSYLLIVSLSPLVVVVVVVAAAAAAAAAAVRFQTNVDILVSVI